MDEWDMDYINFTFKYLWLKFDNNKYIRKDIFYNQNLNLLTNYEDDSEIKNTNNSVDKNKNVNSNNILFKIIYKKVDEYISSKISLNRVFENITNDDDDDDEYINGDFKKNYEILMKNIYLIESLVSNAMPLLLCDVFNICNVVALDLKNKILISYWNCNIYIIFYEKYKYIKLSDSLNGKENIAKELYYEIKHQIEKFLCFTNIDTIFNFYMKEKINLISKLKNTLSRGFAIISLPFLSPLLPLPPQPHSILMSSSPFSSPQLLVNLPNNNNNSNIQEKWSNWDDPKNYLRWWYDDDKKTYCRRYIHFKFNLSEIYKYYYINNHNYNEEDLSNGQKIISLKRVCENMLYLNHLFINDKSLIDYNIIHVDFKKYFFITLNVIKENICEFKTFSFYPFYYKNKTSNDLTIPFSNYLLTPVFNDLHYSDYLHGF